MKLLRKMEKVDRDEKEKNCTTAYDYGTEMRE